MSMKVSSLIDARIGDHPYLFLLLVGLFDTTVKQSLIKQIEAFGEDMGPGGGLVVQKFSDQHDDIAHDIICKAWPKGFSERLEDEVDPLMLIIDKDFNKFDPKQDHWAVIWFSDYKDNVSDFPNVLHHLAKLSREHSDIFAYVQSVARKKELKNCIDSIAQVGKYFIFGNVPIPGTGVSIDVKAILADIKNITETITEKPRWWQFWRK
jgi:hypothetical protein